MINPSKAFLNSTNKSFLTQILPVILILGIGAVIILKMPSLSDRIGESESPQINLILFAIAPLIGVGWLVLLLTGRHIQALLTLIISLPFFTRSTELISINAITTPSGGTVSLGLTTVAILLFGATLLFTPQKGTRPVPIWVIIPLLVYSVTGTISQILNHHIGSALLLSLGAFWQWIVLLYIVCRVVNTPDRVTMVLKAIVLALIVGSLLRIATTGIFFFAKSESGELLRVGGSGFGSPLFYSGYLAMGLVITLFLVRRSESFLSTALWSGAFVLLTMELLNTSTRGGILAFVIGFLVIAILERRRTTIVVTSIFVITLPLTTTLFESAFIGSREFPISSQLLQVPHVQDRIDLIRITVPRLFDQQGFGYGITNTQVFFVNEKMLTSHNLYGSVALEAGGIAMMALIMLTISIGIQFVKIRQSSTDSMDALAIYVGAALIAWLTHANTSSTFITWLVPYEAIFLIFLTAFLFLGLQNPRDLPPQMARH